jgi:SAM-dependent methyltransferase
MAILDPNDGAALRAHYERQGEIARTTGQGVRCSEPSVTQTVLALALPELQRIRRLLDVGCGANLDYDIVLADRGVEIVGIDFAESFLALAPKHERIVLHCADATNLPFPDSSFDTAICSETVEHIPDDRGVVREIARVLQPNGLLVFTVPLLWNLARLTMMARRASARVELMEGHLREYTWKQAQRLLQPHFVIRRIIPVPFGWSGALGTPLDFFVRKGLLARFGKSFAALAQKRG